MTTQTTTQKTWKTSADNWTNRKQALQEAVENVRNGMSLYQATHQARVKYTRTHSEFGLTTRQSTRFICEVDRIIRGQKVQK